MLSYVYGHRVNRSMPIVFACVFLCDFEEMDYIFGTQMKKKSNCCGDKKSFKYSVRKIEYEIVNISICWKFIKWCNTASVAISSCRN